MPETQICDFAKDINIFQDDPESEFMGTSFCCLHVTNGLIALVGNVLYEKENVGKFYEKKKKTEINQSDIAEVLKSRFNITLDFNFNLGMKRKNNF